ncbi:MAG TPA: hypothetical protein VGR16_01740 [Thermomicrobiales bacterium]|nr:hypothetical protein [Thermomicrobiales bacterium]
MQPYPTLAVIDRACDGPDPRFREDPNAAHLERHARELADEYWCDHVWLTGVVPSAVFQAVRSALERERLEMNRPITLLFATETAGSALDIVAATVPPAAGDGSELPSSALWREIGPAALETPAI